MIYYVSANGNNSSDGSINAPFKTINHAAQIAVAGDTVKVFGGTYREWVNPVKVVNPALFRLIMIFKLSIIIIIISTEIFYCHK